MCVRAVLISISVICLIVLRCVLLRVFSIISRCINVGICVEFVESINPSGYKYVVVIVIVVRIVVEYFL